MEVKTYSRARAAVAAAKKVLEHLSMFIVSIEGVPHGDKFAALVTVKAAGGKEISDAIIAAGFPAHLHVEAVAPAEEQEPPKAETVENHTEKTDGYIKETSVVKGACALVHEIAAHMHANHPAVKKADVIEECRKVGIAFGTARTQYQKWLSAKNKG